MIDYNEIKKEIPFRPDVAIFGLSWFEKHKYFDKIRVKTSWYNMKSCKFHNNNERQVC